MSRELAMQIDNETFLIADTHFGHENISKHEPIRKYSAFNNGFKNVDDLMIYNWNKTISDGDTVFHLGDFAFKHKNIAELSNLLNGNKILLVGNHDKQKDINILEENGWKIIDSIVIDIDSSKKVMFIMQKLNRIFQIDKNKNPLACCYIKDIGNSRVMFTHFPLFNDNPYDGKYNNITKIFEYIYNELDCDINIHGHTHSKGAKKSFCKSVCVELIDFKPIRLNDVLNKPNSLQDLQ